MLLMKNYKREFTPIEVSKELKLQIAFGVRQEPLMDVGVRNVIKRPNLFTFMILE